MAKTHPQCRCGQCFWCLRTGLAPPEWIAKLRKRYRRDGDTGPVGTARVGRQTITEATIEVTAEHACVICHLRGHSLDDMALRARSGVYICLSCWERVTETWRPMPKNYRRALTTFLALPLFDLDFSGSGELNPG